MCYFAKFYLSNSRRTFSSIRKPVHLPLFKILTFAKTTVSYCYCWMWDTYFFKIGLLPLKSYKMWSGGVELFVPGNKILHMRPIVHFQLYISFCLRKRKKIQAFQERKRKTDHGSLASCLFRFLVFASMLTSKEISFVSFPG